MPLLSRFPRRLPTAPPRSPAPTTRPDPARRHLPAGIEARVRLSADLLGALLENESRSHATLDDLEWADALADRMLRRRARRQADPMSR